MALSTFSLMPTEIQAGPAVCDGGPIDCGVNFEIKCQAGWLWIDCSILIERTYQGSTVFQ
jgi:hypothetical protein